MGIQEAYNKFSHLDDVLSDTKLLDDDVKNYILYQLWQAVKQEVESQPELPESVAEIHNIAFEREVLDG